MALIEITELSHPIVLDMRYATENNFTRLPIYHTARCFLHPDALGPFEKAIELAAKLNLRLKILDAYRPQYAQERLWQICPDADYVMPPEKGSHHTRGVAIDLTLVDGAGQELDMGTGFDDFRTQSHHGSMEISQEGFRNRLTLLALMMSAGWDFYKNEWWHYQFFNPRSYPLILTHEELIAA